MTVRFRLWWQDSQPRSWWGQIQKCRRSIGVVAIVLIVVVVIALMISVVVSNGTGFNGYNKVSTVHTISGPFAGIVIRTEEYQPGKTLWDWMQLLVIPLVIALGGYIFNLTVSENQQKSTQLRDQTEREIALDDQREAALQAYIDKMSEILLHRKLRDSAEDDEVRNIARVRTLTVLARLDSGRKGTILQFLYESDLIIKSRTIIDLTGADLRGADLSEADLSGADLFGVNLAEANLAEANLAEANLQEANLRGANLLYANLREANLREANLREANLRGANLSEADLNKVNLSEANLLGATITSEQLDTAKTLQGATMPDRSKHS